MHEELLKNIDVWHDNNEFDRIVASILALPKESWGFTVTKRLISAYNNLSKYSRATELLEEIREEGEDDNGWHYLYGYVLYYLDKAEAAAEHFQRSIDLKDDDPDISEFTHRFLKMSLKKMNKEKDERWLKLNRALR